MGLAILGLKDLQEGAGGEDANSAVLAEREEVVDCDLEIAVVVGVGLHHGEPELARRLEGEVGQLRQERAELWGGPPVSAGDLRRGRFAADPGQLGGRPAVASAEPVRDSRRDSPAGRAAATGCAEAAAP